MRILRIDLGEQEGYEKLITADNNLRYQQNLNVRPIAILVLNSSNWPRIRKLTDTSQAAVDFIEGGGYQERLILGNLL